MSNISTLKNVGFMLLQGLVFLLVALYFMLLGHIPLAECIVQPSVQLGVWLGSVVLVVAFTGWLVWRFSYARLLVWAGLVVTVHGLMWVLPDVGIAFDIDACLDRGGRWDNGVCDLGDGIER